MLFQTYIEDAKDEITKLIQENTEKLDQMNMLIVEKKSYEKDLNARQKSLVRLDHLAQLQLVHQSNLKLVCFKIRR